MQRELAREPPCVCALGPHQCQHHYPGSYIAAPAAVTHPGRGQNLQPAKIAQRKQLLQLDCCFLLEPYFTQTAFSNTASVWFPMAILSLQLILHLCLYILLLLHPDGKAKVRKRTTLQVGTGASSSLSGKKKQEY